jgi:hypothetical protein
MPETERHDEPATAGGTDGAPDAAEPEPRTRWFYFALGLSLQTFLWFLLFLAIVVAVLVGGKLTEFRYVGF